MPGLRFVNPNPQFFDDDGDVLAGGSITFMISGTSTLTDTFDDDDLDPGDANVNPVPLDGDGRLSLDVFLDPAVVYRAVLKDANGATIWDKDPLPGADIAAAIAAHNADPDAHQEASESVFGFTQYASQSETNTGTATDRAITPATLAGRTATETRAGVIELATSAEVTTGTDAVRAVTPATLLAGLTATFASAAETLTGTSTTKAITPGGFSGNNLLAASGYYKFPEGFTIQWGTGTSSQDAAQTFTFPTAFATACYGVIVQRTENNVVTPLMPSNSPAPTTTQFTINRDSGISDSVPFFYVAIGV